MPQHGKQRVNLLNMFFGQGAIQSASTGSAPSFDVDYQAVLDYATLQGDTLPAANVQTLQNDLMVGLKADGVYSKLSFFCVLGSKNGDMGFESIDWQSASRKCLDVNGNTRTINGWLTDGISSYVDSQFSLEEDSSITYQNLGISFYVHTNANSLDNGWNGVRASGSSSQTLKVNLQADTNVRGQIISTTSPNVSSGGNGLGIIAAVADATNMQMYGNGVQLYDMAQTNQSGWFDLVKIFDVYFGCQNNSGTSIANINQKEFGVISVTQHLTATEAANYNTRLKTYYNALNALP